MSHEPWTGTLRDCTRPGQALKAEAEELVNTVNWVDANSRRAMEFVVAQV